MADGARRVRVSVAALTLLMAAGLGAAGAGASNADTAASQTRAQQTRQIASSVLGTDYKIALTALRSTEDEYAASVRLQVCTQAHGAWKESDRVTVGDADGWFWYPLTGKGAVCEFSTAVDVYTAAIRQRSGLYPLPRGCRDNPNRRARRRRCQWWLSGSSS